ncbi:hypothetical protein GALMADRAFT_145792 [Galerina marginata CBS 339.88]|uniref:Uncharacterized protein n=1 Tax=Galerina marginata (strain CBS 339.88) TaxID=685588 RepID=A0A067SGC9_GALM3|nr:hypothetical protein GALMADRAFT_145792 [Galerina marginata CBS 339.88]
MHTLIDAIELGPKKRIIALLAFIAILQRTQTRDLHRSSQFSAPKILTMTGFNIRNLSTVSGVQAFVSKYGTEGGNDSWFTVPADFSDPTKAHWERNSYEVVAFLDPVTKIQRGWYINCKDQVVGITFYGFEQDIGLVRG